ncbi:MAG TPA: tRNA (adenosine(37)-N6)-threonylcarbamoyltransferase complex dimerization subunit type 1 TsaB, partial [Bryobacteraceae bacterium]|nr:tRNA (adenosine(37)-N6)-threonylcarbamoyltransferase complex dimerization subunit type 1 TsaB [Bryobacteraceae bacterium]
VLEEVLLHEPQGFSGSLFDRIRALVDRHGVALGEIDLFAGASGPGSFTGVRVGLAAMKGLGEVLGKPVAAVSNLEALAEFGQGNLRAPVIDARRGEVFAALYTAGGAAVIPESVLRFPRFLELAAGYEFEWISSHFDPFRTALGGTPFERYPVVHVPRALAAAIARIAMRRGGSDPAAIEANYVRRSDAELLWKS